MELSVYRVAIPGPIGLSELAPPLAVLTVAADSHPGNTVYTFPLILN